MELSQCSSHCHCLFCPLKIHVHIDAVRIVWSWKTRWNSDTGTLLPFPRLLSMPRPLQLSYMAPHWQQQPKRYERSLRLWRWQLWRPKKLVDRRKNAAVSEKEAIQATLLTVTRKWRPFEHWWHGHWCGTSFHGRHCSCWAAALQWHLVCFTEFLM